MKNKMGLNIKWLTFLLGVVLLMSSCASRKAEQRSYKDYEKKTTQFQQKKYKFHKDFPPVQRYYNKNSLFRPKK